MNLSCKVIRNNNGQIDFVEAPNGEQSNLFKDAVNYLQKNNYEKNQIDRLPQEVEQGNKRRGKVNAEATYFLQRNTEKPRNLHESSTKQEQENLLERYAKDNDLWIENWSDYNKKHKLYYLDAGAEAFVYVNQERTKAIKLITPYTLMETPQEMLDRFAISNKLFEATEIKVIGFTRYEGGFNLVVEQPFIKKGKEALTDSEIEDFMKELGFNQYAMGSTTYYNDAFVISDAHNGNIVRGEDGRIYVIDVATALNTPSEDVGGLMEYRVPKGLEENNDNRKEKALDIWTVAYTLGFKKINGDWESNSNSLTLDTNGEPSLKDVLSYIKKVRVGEQRLSKKELTEIANNLYSLPVNSLEELYQEVRKTFYSKGYFDINEKDLKKSNLYNNIEVLEILSNPQLQNNIRNLVEKIENEYISENSDFNQLIGTYSFDNQDLLQDGTSFVGIGKMKALNPLEVHKQIAEVLGGIKDRNYFDTKINNLPFESIIEKYNSDKDFADAFFSRYSKLKKIRELKEIEGQTSNRLQNDYSLTLREVLLTDIQDQKLKDDISFLNEIPSDIWVNNFNEVQAVLKEIENKAINYNIDIIGLSEISQEKSQQEVIDFLNSLNVFVNGLDNYTIESTDIDVISGEINVFFNNLNEVKNTFDIVEGTNSDKTLVSITPTSSELNLFKKDALIETSEGYYHKVKVVNDKSKLYDLVYNLVIEDNKLLPKEAFYPTAFNVNNEFDLGKLNDAANKEDLILNLRKYVLKSIYDFNGQVNEQDFDTIEKLMLYKLLYKHPTKGVKKVDYDIEKLKFSQFKGNFNYLTTDFISDFYNYSLQQKARDTNLYNEVLRHFEINERGITLLNTDPHTLQKIKLLTPDNKIFTDLFQYSLISKDKSMQKLIFNDEGYQGLDDINFKRAFYSNNPSSLPYYKGGYDLDGDVLITNNIEDLYLKVKEGVYEKVNEQGNVRFYKKLPNLLDSYYNNYSGAINFDRRLNIDTYHKFIQESKDLVKLNKLYSRNEAQIIKNKIDECG